MKFYPYLAVILTLISYIYDYQNGIIYNPLMLLNVIMVAVFITSVIAFVHVMIKY
jgi:hypothetical protein